MKLYKNVDMVQINVKAGVQEYFLPKNVDWADKVIDKIVVYCGNVDDGEEMSPIDGITPIMDRDAIENLYFDFYSDNDVEIAHNLSAEQILFSNNEPIEINSKLSLKLSRIFFIDTDVPCDNCLLLYIYYGEKEVNEDIPQRSVTVAFDIKGGEEIYLSDVIDSYINAQNAKVKGIYAWCNLFSGTGVFMTLRNRNYETIIRNFPIRLCRPPMSLDEYYTASPVPAEWLQTHSFYIDSEDIDFANSTIQNTYQYGVTNVKLTFLY